MVCRADLIFRDTHHSCGLNNNPGWNRTTTASMFPASWRRRLPLIYGVRSTLQRELPSDYFRMICLQNTRKGSFRRVRWIRYVGSSEVAFSVKNAMSENPAHGFSEYFASNSVNRSYATALRSFAMAMRLSYRAIFR